MSQTSSTNATNDVSSDLSRPVPMDALDGTVFRDDVTHLNVGPITSIDVHSDQQPPPILDPQSLDPILTRDHLIHTTSVDGVEIFNANQLGLFDPFDKFFTLSSIAEVTKSYTYWRGSLRVRVVVTPPGSCFGSMVLSAICEGSPTLAPSLTSSKNVIDDADKDSCFTAFNDTFRVINFEQATSVEMILPFVYWQNYAPLRGPALWMWRLQLQSLVNIQSTISTTASAVIKIYAALEPGYELCVPYYQMKKSSHGLEGFNSSSGSKKSFNASSSTKTKFSDVASMVGGIASKVGGVIPALAPFTTPLAVGANIVSSVASFLGFTRETTYIPPEPFIQRYFTQPCYADGVDSGDKLVTLQGSALAIDPAIGAGELEDPMCFEYVRQRWGMVGYFELSTASAAGTILYQLPVTPSYAGVHLGLTYFTPGGYYGLPFAHWRGGMEYLIYIPSSGNMRGMLQIFYNPHPTASAPTGLVSADKTGLAHSVSLDLSGTQQHLIQVPYAGPEVCKENQPMCDGKYSNRVQVNCNGSLDFYLSMPWVAPRTGSLTTKVIILARPMGDMQYADIRGRFNEGTNPLPIAMRYQSGPVDTSVPWLETTILNQPMGPTYNLAQLSTTEVAPSGRALVQKFSTVYGVNRTWESIAFNFFHMIGRDGTPYATFVEDGGAIVLPSQPWTWAGHYSLMYTGYRGSVRYKLTDEGPTTLDTDHTVNVWATSLRHVYREVEAVRSAFQTESPHYVAQPFGTHNAVEFSFPYVSDRLYYNPREMAKPVEAGGAEDKPWYRTILFKKKNVDAGGNIFVLTAGGDDFSVTRFRRVPVVVGAALIPSS